MSVSDLLYSRITQKRYRDVSVHVRSCVLDGLAAIMLALPEVYVQVRCVVYIVAAATGVGLTVYGIQRCPALRRIDLWRDRQSFTRR